MFRFCMNIVTAFLFFKVQKLHPCLGLFLCQGHDKKATVLFHHDMQGHVSFMLRGKK